LLRGRHLGWWGRDLKNGSRRKSIFIGILMMVKDGLMMATGPYEPKDPKAQRPKGPKAQRSLGHKKKFCLCFLGFWVVFVFGVFGVLGVFGLLPRP
jgi:hypothetical protein